MFVYVAVQGQLSHLEHVDDLPCVGEIVTVGDSDWVITRIFLPLTSEENDFPVINLHPVTVQETKKRR